MLCGIGSKTEETTIPVLSDPTEEHPKAAAETADVPVETEEEALAVEVAVVTERADAVPAAAPPTEEAMAEEAGVGSASEVPLADASEALAADASAEEAETPPDAPQADASAEEALAVDASAEEAAALAADAPHADASAEEALAADASAEVEAPAEEAPAEAAPGPALAEEACATSPVSEKKPAGAPIVWKAPEEEAPAEEVSEVKPVGAPIVWKAPSVEEKKVEAPIEAAAPEVKKKASPRRPRPLSSLTKEQQQSMKDILALPANLKRRIGFKPLKDGMKIGFSLDEHSTTVKRVIENTQAYWKGVKPGWNVLSVNEVPIDVNTVKPSIKGAIAEKTEFCILFEMDKPFKPKVGKMASTSRGGR